MTYVDTHAADDQHRRVLLLQWVFGYFAAYDLPVVTNGSTGAPVGTWTPLAFSVSGLAEQAGQLMQTSRLEVADAAGVWFTTVVTASDFVGSSIRIWEAWLDAAGSTMVSQQEVLRHGGMANTWSSGPEKILVEVGPALVFRGVPIPRRPYTNGCTFAFKGPLCGYTAGLTTCARTFDDCTTRANTARFGGFPRIDAAR